MTKDFLQKVLKVQGQMLVEKGNKAKQYQYRSLKDVNAKAKPICNEMGLLLTYTDDLEERAGRVFVVSHCILTDTESGESIETKASVEIDAKPQFMSLGQNGGSSSSYARKYAADALFCLDGECDLDDKNDEIAQKKDEQEKADGNEYVKRDGAGNTLVKIKAGFVRLDSLSKEQISKLMNIPEYAEAFK